MTASTRPNVQRSAFTAAFLSLLFPGLGQAYAGAPRRALAVAAAPLAFVVLLAAVYVSYGNLRDFGLWLSQSSVLGPFLVLNVLMFAYRAAASVDAYRIAQYANAYALTPSLGRPRLSAEPLSLVGLAAIVLVMAAGHAWLGYWDYQFFNLNQDIHSIVTIPAGPSASSVASGPAAPQGTPPPASSVQPWDAKSRLNILLVGVDQRPAQNTFNTDTMIVVSIDPSTHRVSMFSLPRDMLGVPLPPNSGLSYLFGLNYNDKINSLWAAADSHRDLFPGGGAQALKQAIGYLYGINIQYYVMVNFQGFQQVVDTFGGVTLDVEVPVVDDLYPGSHGHLRVYIPPGYQHMTGSEALIYARSRHGSNDFDRANRQQRVIAAIEQEADLNAISAHLSALISELGQAVHTDIPEGPGVLGPLLDQARYVKAADIASYVFDPPVYGVEHNDPQLYWIAPKVPQIRAAVQDALANRGPDPATLQGAATEQAPIVVENGTGVSGQAGVLASYLQGLGLAAQASSAQPAQLGGPTRIEAVNGAETTFPTTAKLLQQLLAASVTTGAGSSGSPAPSAAGPSPPIEALTDPSLPAEFIVVTGSNTPSFTQPPG